MSEKDTIQDNKSKLLDAEKKVSDQKQVKNDSVEKDDIFTSEEKQKMDKKIESKNEILKDSRISENVKVDKNLDDKNPKRNKTLTTTPLNNSQKQKKSNDSEKKTNQVQRDLSSKNNEQSEYIEKLVSINRVAKVVKGGRRFSFAALVVVGDGNGMVGHGKGKAKEVPEAIKKATEEAKSKMIRVPLRQGRTLHHDIKGRFDSGKVYLRSAPSGTGVIAGGPMRAVFEALGIQDIVAKSVGTSNPHNMVRATFEALKSASSPKIIAVRRSLKINDITKRRKISNFGGENVKN